MLAGTLIALVISAVALINIEHVLQSRQLQVMDLASASSWQVRENLEARALEQIKDAPLLGVFGGQFLVGQSSGSYAHNVLSAWVSYGAVGFFLILVVSFIPLAHALRRIILSGESAPIWTFSFMMSSVCCLLMLVSKSVFWPLPALAWGLYVNALSQQSVSRRMRRGEAVAHGVVPIRAPGVAS